MAGEPKRADVDGEAMEIEKKWLEIKSATTVQNPAIF